MVGLNLLKHSDFLPLCSCGILFFNFFPCNICVWFWHQSNAGIIDCVWMCSVLLIFKEFVKNWCCSLDTWQNTVVKPSGFGIFLWDVVIYMFKLSILLTCVFIFKVQTLQTAHNWVFYIYFKNEEELTHMPMPFSFQWIGFYPGLMPKPVFGKWE